jgi:mono/diheme cytochrome c family protein
LGNFRQLSTPDGFIREVHEHLFKFGPRLLKRACFALVPSAALLLVLLYARAVYAEPQVDAAAPAENQQPESQQAENQQGDAAQQSHPIDFFLDIQPILTAHCFKCHGAEKRSGGLRLDLREFAEAGGDSGKPIFGGTPETNELLARVSSSDRTYRMPKNAPPLTDEQIALVKRWVAEGTPWSTLTHEPIGRAPKPFFEDALLWIAGVTDVYKSEFEFAKPYAIAFVVLQLGLLFILRTRQAVAKGRPWTRGRAAGIARVLNRVTPLEILLAWCLTVVIGGAVLAVGHARKLEGDLAQAHKNAMRFENPWSRTVYGYPPVPLHFDQPKQLAGTYYRGNCERNPQLYNHGNYLTAIFRISLCDRDRRALSYGDTVPSDGLFVRVEVERAPGTTEALFSKELMGSVFLTTQFLSDREMKLERTVTRLETLEPGKLWAAYVPIEESPQNDRITGLFYIYTGRAEMGLARGQPHYGVKYDLGVHDGQLAEDSDLWMNSFGNPAVQDPQPPDKIPYREWFDYRPLPVIEGENSQDPKLLGVDEYVRKGLISPPQPKADSPRTEPSDDAPDGEAPSDAPHKDE